MDAFFAAIEERDNPQWRGMPLVVGADPKHGTGRGVVSTANYAARQFGIRSAMPIRKAWELAHTAATNGKPHTIFLPGNYRHYGQVSHRIMALVRQLIPIVEQRSVDEAYGDISFTQSFATARLFCQELQRLIFVQEQLTVSIGIGPNKLVAKIASDLHKPNGLVVISPSIVQSQLAPLRIEVIPGIGPKTAALLHHHHIVTIADLHHASRDVLGTWLGRWGEKLYDKIRGKDTSLVQENPPPKSISKQSTLRYDTLHSSTLLNLIMELCQDVTHELHTEGFLGAKTLTVTVRYADFTTTSKARTYHHYLRTYKDIVRAAFRQVLPYLDSRLNPHHNLIRLLGVRLQKFHKASKN